MRHRLSDMEWSVLQDFEAILAVCGLIASLELVLLMLFPDSSQGSANHVA